MESYLLLECSSGMVWKVADEIVKINGIKMAHAVTGHFDVIAYAEFSNIDELTLIIQNIQLMIGVKKTQTAVAMPKQINCVTHT